MTDTPTSDIPLHVYNPADYPHGAYFASDDGNTIVGIQPDMNYSDWKLLKSMYQGPFSLSPDAPIPTYTPDTTTLWDIASNIRSDTSLSAYPRLMQVYLNTSDKSILETANLLFADSP